MTVRPPIVHRTLAALRILPLLILVAAPGPRSAPKAPPVEPPAAVAPAEAVPLPPPAPEPAAPTPQPPLTWNVAGDTPYIPILMYHYIREVDAAADPLGFRLSVRPERFEEQLAWLRERGYSGLRMGELARCLRVPEGCPARAVALTFDDGYADNADVALPLLARYGFPATFYIVTGFVGREGYMNWADLERLRDGGMEIGAHTMSHADLAALSLDEARVEIEGSKRLLEERLGVEVVSFSYPAGSYSPLVRSLVREAGFTSAVTTSPGERLTVLDALPRRRVLGGETIEGYSWYFAPPSALTR